MMIVGRLFMRAAAFALAFSVDVRAKAANSASLKPANRAATLPRGCATNGDAANDCAARTGPGEKLDLALKEGSCVLDRSSAADRQTGGTKLILLSGGAWARIDGAAEISSEFGEVEISAGDAWVWREGGKLWVDAIAGDVALHSRGAGDRRIRVAPGMRNWLGPVGAKTGEAQTGFPQALDARAHLIRLARVFDGDRDEFASEAESLAKTWRAAVREIASIDENRARERREELESEEQARLASIAAREAKRREIRSLFWRKTLE